MTSPPSRMNVDPFRLRRRRYPEFADEAFPRIRSWTFDHMAISGWCYAIDLDVLDDESEHIMEYDANNLTYHVVQTMATSARVLLPCLRQLHQHRSRIEVDVGEPEEDQVIVIDITARRETDATTLAAIDALAKRMSTAAQLDTVLCLVTSSWAGNRCPYHPR